MGFRRSSYALSVLAGVAAVVVAVGRPWAAEEPVRWKMASAVSSSVVILGTTAMGFTEKIAAISGGDFVIKFYEPGALVPPLEMFDAVAKGSIDAAWGPSGLWAGKIRAAPLFSAVPFGPSAGEYLAWVYHGGGQELWREILARSDIYSVFCSLEAPEASGWFREEITSVDDLRGLKMRFLGLGALTMEKLGVSTQLLAPADVYPALERGVIDATELSVPAVDLNLGFYEIAKHYYFPGWHQPATLVDLMVHLPRWQELSDTHKAQIKVACRASIVDNLALAEALQFKALQELQAKGVQLHRWPPEMLAAFEAAWQEVAAEQAAEDADFKRAWESLQAFRADYKVWKGFGISRLTAGRVQPRRSPSKRVSA
jgi:TRAP-type mannitol/chloroaromatic compound transport system substrate-binding protein